MFFSHFQLLSSFKCLFILLKKANVNGFSTLQLSFDVEYEQRNNWTLDVLRNNVPDNSGHNIYDSKTMLNFVSFIVSNRTISCNSPVQILICLFALISIEFFYILKIASYFEVNCTDSYHAMTIIMCTVKSDFDPYPLVANYPNQFQINVENYSVSYSSIDNMVTLFFLYYIKNTI